MKDSYIWKPCKIQNVHFYEAMLYNTIFETPTVLCGILEPVQLSKVWKLKLSVFLHRAVDLG